MSRLTTRMEIERRRTKYNVPASTDAGLFPLFFAPLDEVGTKKRFNIGRGHTLEQYDFDLFDSGLVGDGLLPNSFLVSDALFGGLTKIVPADSFAALFCGTAAALSTWNRFKLGTSAVSSGAVDLVPGNVVIEQDSSTSVTLSYTTGISSNDDFALLLTHDRSTNVYNVYESINGGDFELKDTTTDSSISTILFPAPVDVIYNVNVGSKVYGAALFCSPPGAGLPENILANMKATSDNWLSGDPTLVL